MCGGNKRLMKWQMHLTKSTEFVGKKFASFVITNLIVDFRKLDISLVRKFIIEEYESSNSDFFCFVLYATAAIYFLSKRSRIQVCLFQILMTMTPKGSIIFELLSCVSAGYAKSRE